jgi:hypothetical protein
MPDVLSTVQATFLSIDSQYNLLRAVCSTQQQRDSLGNQYAEAQEAYLACIGKVLRDDDPEISALSIQLKAANAKIAQAVGGMGNMNKVIDDITTAVSLGALLVGKIAG